MCDICHLPCVGSGKWRTAVSGVRLLAPIYDPEKVVCIGMNYREHCTEQNVPTPVTDSAPTVSLEASGPLASQVTHSAPTDSTVG